jgi:UDP-N-acetylmuramate--alanine ligase
MSWTDRGLFVRPGERTAAFRLTRRIHFVAIGGVGMSGIAEVLIHLGFEVSGSDVREGPQTQRLQEMGAQVWLGHDAQHVSDVDVVVFSSAVPQSNPELVEARRKGIPVIRRAEMLAELMRLKHGVAVAGSHGKTTTSSLIATVLTEGGLEPTVIVGGKLLALGGTAVLGGGEYLVAEADESDGTFLRLDPTIAVITNVDHEHMDHYGDMEAVRKAFVDFMDRVPFYGKVIACSDDPELAALLPRIRWTPFTYGSTENCDLQVSREEGDDSGTRLRFWLHGNELGTCQLPLFGAHNAMNAAAAVATGLELGLNFEQISRALVCFGGVGRRLEQKGEVGGILVVDDYGHHPTELGVTIEALRESFDRRLVVVFQPHRYTRTRDHHEAFARVLAQADEVGILPIYAASEDPIEGVDSELIASRLEKEYSRPVKRLRTLDEAVEWAKKSARSGDLWLTQGAGDITHLADLLLCALADRIEEEA